MDSAGANNKLSLQEHFIIACSLFLICILFYNGVFFFGTHSFLAEWDNSNQIYAWLTKIHEALRNGEFPLWDFNTASGISLIGELQPGCLYLPNLIFVLLAPKITPYLVDLFVLFHFWIASYATYYFLRINQFSWLSSLVGALSFTYLGFLPCRAH